LKYAPADAVACQLLSAQREKAEMLTSEAARPSVLRSGSRRLERSDKLPERQRAEKRSPKGEAC
jgi:hypothetical protein